MKQLYAFCTIFLFILAEISAQTNSNRITGQVKDDNGKSLQAATISLLRSTDSALVKVAVTNPQGNFEFEKIADGSYVVSITAVGYTKNLSRKFEVSASNSTVQLPEFQLRPTGKALGEVTVTGRRPLIENKIDRTVINVDAAPTNAGSTAMEVLEKSPGISVSNDGVISLKGKQGVIVMMDGKPTYLSAADLANVLKNMPASALDQIEIMPNPPAKYDASGNSGIINIKTKKSRNDGFNGSITIGASAGLLKIDDSYISPLRTNNSFNFNYRKNKWNIFGNYNFNYREGKGELNLSRKFYEKSGSLNSVSESETNFDFRNNNHTLKLGFDYYVDKKNVFGVVFTGFGFFGRPRPTSSQVIMDPQGNVEVVLNSFTKNDLNLFNYSANFNYKHNFDSAGREITIDLDYVGYNNTTKSLLTTEVLDGSGNHQGSLVLKGDIPSIINIYSAKTDYTHPLKNDMRFDAGLKLSYVKTDNEVDYRREEGGVFVHDSRSNHFIYEENINAAYASINKKWKKWSAQVGLRLENTVAKGTQITTDSVFKRDYTNLFPTAYLNYELSKKHGLTLSYGRRVDRPNYQDLNPFVWFLDSLTYRQGNPYLLPQFSNNFELRYTYAGKYTATINYALTNDVISQILKQNTESRTTFLTSDNVAEFRNVGIAFNVPAQFAKWWSSNIFLNIYNNKYTGSYFNSFTGKNDPIDVQYSSFLVNVSNTFTLKKGWTLEASGFYRGKGVEQLSVAEPMYFFGFGGQKTILKGKGTLRLNIRDPFHWQRYRAYTRYSDIDVRIRNKWDNRNATLTFSYRFGKSTVAQARRRSTGTSEEQNRAGGGGAQQ